MERVELQVDDRDRGLIADRSIPSVAPMSGGAGWARRLMSLWVIFGVVAVWQALAGLQIFPPLDLPAPARVVATAWQAITIGYGGVGLWHDIWVSALRVAAGFAAAVAVGVPIGMLMAESDWVFRAIDPLLQFVRPVPPLAYIPLLVVWFGIGELPKIILILLGTLPVVIISTVSGVRATPPQRIRVALCLGASRLQVFRHVILPSALPEIFTGMRVGIGVAWTCLVAAEMIAASAGLGWLVQDAGQQLQVAMIFVGIVAIGLLGYGMDLGIRALERAAVPWKGHG